MTRIAVCSRSFSKHPILRAELTARYGRSVTFNDAGLSLSGQALIDFVRGHDKAITALEKLDDAFFTALPELRVIGKYGVGLDMIDLESMRRHDVRLGWTGGVNKRSVSELVIACAIALLRHVPQANAEVRAGQWRQLMGRQLTGKTVGIVGCGHIGKDLAGLLNAFGCTVLANDILDFPEFYAAHKVTAVDLETLLTTSDIVTLHLPAGPSTRNILNAERLALLSPRAILINAARGGLVDEPALKAMLSQGRLAAAAFDVFHDEPPDDLELLHLPNFLALPHIGGSAEEAVLAMGMAAIKGLEDHCLP
ncbi:MAG: phosphoglycerate dehydrogenase and related [Rhodospirillaceae bacterium]|nr:MAG: phosphoglycerate dehydrogenase and related [Rhodospirillaceae bacterium]TNC97406.1 MAG: phosphoglycerate dehydrogenase and related dehydrogenase [Stygiobacter sp.]